VFNSEKSHESKIRTRPHTPRHDPARVRVPAYHPDIPEVRRDWAQYYDKVSEADADAGRVLAELEADGLAEDTIVFYFGDHGSGMPRSKRWCHNSGLHVPLVIFIPEKFKHLRPKDYRAGGRSDQLISFVDFAPTVLSLAGVRPPDWMQGRAFLGGFAGKPHEFLHGSRGRMDERLDLIRSVTDGRFVYIRNYMPHLIYGQHLDYMWQTPTTRVWEKLFTDGKLNAAQSAFWKPKPSEELYDLQNDPDEVNNLAESPAHQKTKARLREAQRQHVRAIRDVGFIPEGERFKETQGRSAYDFARQRGQEARLARIVETAEAASSAASNAKPFLDKLSDADSAVRYWAMMGLMMRGTTTVAQAAAPLRAALNDPAPEVRIAAAEALLRFGPSTNQQELVALLVHHADWNQHNVFSAIAALNSLYRLPNSLLPPAEVLRALPTNGPASDARFKSYVPRLLADLHEKLEPANER
jgi:hypothetical protein